MAAKKQSLFLANSLTMWITAVVIFISIAAYQCDDFEDCMDMEAKECLTFGSPKIPENKHEFDETCNTFQKVTKCSLPIAEKCGKNHTSIPIMKKMVRTLEIMCDPDTEMYKVIVNNLSCLKSVTDFDPHRCDEIAKQLMGEDAEEEDNSNICMIWSYRIACILMAVEERCGTEPKQAMLEILTNAIPNYVKSCSEDQIAMMPEVIEAFEKAAKEYDASKEENRNIKGNDFSCLKQIADGDYEQYHQDRCIQILNKMMEDSDEEQFNICMFYSYHVACSLNIVDETCGTGSKNLMLTSMKKLFPDYMESCSDEGATLSETLKAYETAANELDAVKKDIRKNN